ncbi:MAG: murein biosynthesis integral membrane protein MurJ, partial [Candidatus Rokuibacteriota bacterium]
MSVGTVLSRVTGLVRLAAITAALGVAEGKLADTYNLANTFPNIVYELILGGILTSVFVPVFVELLEKEGRERAWEVASSLLNIGLVVLAAVAVVGVLAAPWIAGFYAVRLEGAQAEAQREIMTFLLRLFVPQLFFYGLAAMTAGLLHAHKRFGPPMYTPILNNLAVAAVFVAFHQAYGSVSLDADPAQLWIIGGGTTLGVALMAAAQLPFLRRLGRFRLRVAIGHPAVRKLAGLSVFVIGVVVVRQLSYVAIQWLANAQTGGYSAYLAAYTFFILPQSLFALSVATALLPTMSEHAVHERWTEFRERLSLGIRATLLFVVPSAAGYLVLGRPLVEVVLENGVMTGASTSLVSGVLAVFVLGLPQFAIFQLLMRAFYALQDSRTPFLLVCATAVVNMAINVPMFSLLGVTGLAVGEAVAYTFA